MKIAILGFSGCGKSTLAQKLGKKYNLPVLHLDRIQFAANWVERELEDKLRDTADFLDSHDSWVMDGNYSNLLQERRLEEADRIIILELNRFVCLWRVLKRWLTYRGSSRPDMAEDCEEKVDWEFLRWVLHDGRTKKRKAHMNEIARRYPNKCVRIRTRKEQKAFLAKEDLR